MKSNDDPKKQNPDLHQQHRAAMQSLDGYSAFLESLHLQTETLETGQMRGDPLFSDFEEYAAAAVQNFLDTSPNSLSGDAQVLAKHDCAAVTVTQAGQIQQTNEQARTDFGLISEKTLDECNIQLLGDTDGPVLRSLLETEIDTLFHILQARITTSDTYLTAAISRIEDAEASQPLFLILLIRPPDSSLATQILTQKFGFTNSEADVAKAFLDGVSLREIAGLRKRSYTTIRNQFQCVLDKSGCDSQTAFFRLAFSLLQLADRTKQGTAAASPTKTRVVSLPRPKGRVVELAICGDEMGQPLLSLPSLFGHGITAEIEALLHERHIFLISVMRPGFGDTSPAPQDADLFDCTAADVAAILNSLEITSCPIIARASAARPFYNLLSRLPDRFTKGVMVNGLIPRNYIAGKTVASKWTTALMSVSVLSFPIAKLILGTGNRLLMRSKGGAFLQKMYQESPSDQIVLTDADVIHSIKSGVQKITQQGLTSGVLEIVDGFKNWSDELAGVTTQVTLYHGADDPNVPIEGVAEFANDHPSVLTLITESKGGGQLGYSHFSRILDIAFGTE